MALNHLKLLNIPEEVIESGILPFLQWNDLLRLRRVCRNLKDITDRYVRINPDLAPELEINGFDKDLSAILELDIPTTKIYLKNGLLAGFFEKDEQDMRDFLEWVGPLVKHLRVNQLSAKLSEKEKTFLNNFINLRTLKVDHVVPLVDRVEFNRNLEFLDWLGLWTAFQTLRDQYVTRDNYPAFLCNLKEIDIGQYDNRFRGSVFLHVVAMDVLLTYNSVLEKIKLPIVPSNLTLLLDELYMCLHILFGQITSYIKKEGSNLKLIDFGNDSDPGWSNPSTRLDLENSFVASRSMVTLCTTCSENGVRLNNVNSVWLTILLTDMMEAPLNAGQSIYSLVNFHPSLFFLDLPNLQEIQIKSTRYSSTGRFNWRRPEWPTLKKLGICVDSRVDICHAEDPELARIFGQPTSTLFDFFFKNVSRLELTELELSFKTVAGGVSVPNCKEIGTSCPNLKKLRIVNWPGQGISMDLAKLWKRLRFLEEVVLDSCEYLDDSAFLVDERSLEENYGCFTELCHVLWGALCCFGMDSRKPVFLSLKHLKKLELRGLDKMPLITDALFQQVICRLPLTHLTLTSSGPLENVLAKLNVTASGITALLKGRFAECIEKFSFKDWSLANISCEEFKNLECQFRSYRMI